MHKRIKHLIKNMKDVFDIDEINRIAKDTKFVQRKSNVTAKAEGFLVANDLITPKRYNQRLLQSQAK